MPSICPNGLQPWLSGPFPSANRESPDVCSVWTGLSQDKDLWSSLEQETACWRIPGIGSCELALWPPSPAGCLRPSVDLVSCSWLENEWASLSKEASGIPTSTGYPTAGFLMICTCLAGFAIAGQKQLGEPPPTLLHCRAPLDGPTVFLAPPPLVLLLGFLGSGPYVMRALEKNLLCCPFCKNWLLPSWPTGGPSLWCMGSLNCIDDFGVGFLGTLKWLVRLLWRACWSLMVKIFWSDSWGYRPTRLYPWNGAVLALAICSSCSCSCPKAMSLWINWRLDTADVS